MIRYRFARPGEEEEILDLINAVFSQAARPHDFARLLPKVYAHPGFAPMHAVAEVDGRLRGAVGLLPMTLAMGKDQPPLRLGYVGSVAVHPRYRGQGCMRALMAMQAEQARRLGYDFLALGGQRQRYQYYGFENACLSLAFTVTAANARHALAGIAPAGLERLSGPEDAALPALYALHEAQPSRCPRPRDRFYDILRSYNGVPWLIRDEGGSPAGYLIALNDEITELILKDEALLPAVLRAWLADKNSCQVRVPGWRTDRAAALNVFAEGCCAADCQMLRVMNWETTLSAALAFRQQLAPLPEGRRVIRVEGAGAWALEVKDGKTRVSAALEQPCLSLEEKRAAALFFSPFSLLSVRDPLLRCWLPLPLDIPAADQF